MSDDKIKDYPRTDNFWVKNTIGVPHPYCIGVKHVAWAAHHHNGMLGSTAIEDAERNGKNVHCGMKGCKLKYAEHKQALLVAVKDTRDLNDIPELKAYILSIKERTEKDGFVGFAFVKEE
jgi:hypothetical protein